MVSEIKNAIGGFQKPCGVSDFPKTKQGLYDVKDIVCITALSIYALLSASVECIAKHEAQAIKSHMLMLQLLGIACIQGQAMMNHCFTLQTKRNSVRFAALFCNVISLGTAISTALFTSNHIYHGCVIINSLFQFSKIGSLQGQRYFCE